MNAFLKKRGGSWMKPVIKITNRSSKIQCKYGRMGPKWKSGGWGYSGVGVSSFSIGCPVGISLCAS
jgi:hypothetical protein